MEEIFRVIYYAVGAIIFAGAISLMIYCDTVMDKEYEYILHNGRYSEVKCDLD